MCVRDADDRCVLQFTLRNAAGCALQRRASRVIHRSELCVASTGRRGFSLCPAGSGRQRRRRHGPRKGQGFGRIVCVGLATRTSHGADNAADDSGRATEREPVSARSLESAIGRERGVPPDLTPRADNRGAPIPAAGA